MIDWNDFIECKRGLLIAPAGHGKTTAIADCLLQCPEGSCQLVLTHTHAGIASLREKFHKKNIPSSKYQLETITGFAQRYVLSFLGASVLPNENEKGYFNFAVEKCGVLLQSNVIQMIIKSSYDGVFVDEYQDCTIDQHNMIMALAYNLPLHVLGDSLQGIFSFENKPLVNFDKDLGLFRRFDLLNYPWRWEKTNPSLGQCILDIRKCLDLKQDVELKNIPCIGLYVVNCHSYNDEEKYRCLRQLIQRHDSNSLLILCPSYYTPNKYGKVTLRGVLKDRISIKQRIDYANRFIIVDAIDSSEYYKCAKEIDIFVEKCRKDHKINKVAKLYDILSSLHLNITELRKWIKREKNSFIKKRKREEATLSLALIELFETFEKGYTLRSLNNVITFIIKLPQIRCYHNNLYNAINKCFSIAQANSISMLEAMKLLKTRIRHQGRKIEGRCIGTTLLTKGLEFDTVILWEADKFEDPKNFYVAISRACNKLVIMTETTTLSFNH